MSPPLAMLCHEQKSVPVGPEWVIEQKWDGWRFLFHRTDEVVRAFAGRNGSDRTGQAKAVEALLATTLPEATTIDCELLTVDPRMAVSSALARGRALYAVAFDVLEVLGEDVRQKPWYERRALLEVIGKGFDGSIVKLSPVNNGEVDHQEWHDALVEAGAEGTVSKLRNSPYVGGRSRAWVKVKKVETCEARVIGFKAGTNEWAGTIGAFEVELLDTKVRTTVGTRGTEQRMAVTADPKFYLGRVLELTCNGTLSKGAPRHPQFSRWREDRG